MGMITNIRAPVPLGETHVPPASSAPKQPLRPEAGATAPVAATQMVRAVQQAPSRLPASEARLLETRMTADESAAHAAQAARDAYIKASIAAGITPLPLP